MILDDEIYESIKDDTEALRLQIDTHIRNIETVIYLFLNERFAGEDTSDFLSDDEGDNFESFEIFLLPEGSFFKSIQDLVISTDCPISLSPVPLTPADLTEEFLTTLLSQDDSISFLDAEDIAHFKPAEKTSTNTH